jgi:hypothetical protein
MQLDISPPLEYCKNAPAWTPECHTSGVFDNSGGYGIEFTDSKDLQDWTQERFMEYWEELRSVSQVMAARKAADTLMCTQWRLIAS